MALIEDVAAYLDGDGRTESRGLPREASFVYATESMRLTTRLMQLASWLLLQRAVNEGELTAENARSEKEKVKFSATPVRARRPRLCRPARERCATIIGKGDRLFERVLQFDKLERGKMSEIGHGRERHRRPAGAAQGGVRAADGVVGAMTWGTSRSVILRSRIRSPDRRCLATLDPVRGMTDRAE